MQANNGFREIVKYINSVNTGSFIYRKELLSIRHGLSNGTIDRYRHLLTVTGYLKETGIKFVGLCYGRYKKVKDIPETHTYNTLRKEYEAAISK